MGSVIAGVTIHLAAFGDMPEALGQVITGTLLSIACMVWAFIGLEERDDA
jgi:hypothetical protein